MEQSRDWSIQTSYGFAGRLADLADYNQRDMSPNRLAANQLWRRGCIAAV
jgi:hypothetical protein